MSTTPAGSTWSQTYAYTAHELIEPRSLDELRETVAGARHVRALGTRHSFSAIADSPGVLVSLGRLPADISVAPDRRSVTVGGGVRYGELARELDAQGLALANMASLPHISVAGCMATATHGSGLDNRNLAAAVRGLEIVTADGDLVAVSPAGDPDSFEGLVVGLGAFGMVTRVTVEVEPAFAVRQAVYLDLPAAVPEVEALDAVLGCAYSVSLFTRWQGPSFEQVWVKQKVGGTRADLGVPSDEASAFPDTLAGATRAQAPIHPLPALPARNCTDQSGAPGPVHERIPHFRLEFMPSAGDEIQSEYLIGREHLAEAVVAVRALARRLDPVLHVSEIRTVAADDLWMSTAQGRDSAALHFTWKRDPEGVAAVLPVLEAALEPFAPRPHWGKVHRIAPEVVRDRYPLADRFSDLVARWDPEGTFGNEMLRGLRITRP